MSPTVQRRLVILALTSMLVACGGGEEGGSATLPSAFNPFDTGHRCAEPALSNSPEQKACFAEAAAACPEGQEPNQTEFEQRPDGQFLVIGYICA